MNEYTTAGFGVAINGKHTWKDYGLVIGNTDIVGEPFPKTNCIESTGKQHQNRSYGNTDRTGGI